MLNQGRFKITCYNVSLDIKLYIQCGMHVRGSVKNPMIQQKVKVSSVYNIKQIFDINVNKMHTSSCILIELGKCKHF